MRLEQVLRFSIQGSWLRKDRRGGWLGLEAGLHVVSGEPKERIREYVRAGERACFTIQSLRPDVPVRTEVTLNDEPLDMESGGDGEGGR